MSKSPAREWRFYVDDMIGCAERVMRYTADRNRLIHGYLGIDNDTVWSIVSTDVPRLLMQFQHVRQSGG
jgi:uncharacterized protein with HEPN domain